MGTRFHICFSPNQQTQKIVQLYLFTKYRLSVRGLKWVCFCEPRDDVEFRSHHQSSASLLAHIGAISLNRRKVISCGRPTSPSPSLLISKQFEENLRKILALLKGNKLWRLERQHLLSFHSRMSKKIFASIFQRTNWRANTTDDAET